jgi:hypothetical protein
VYSTPAAFKQALEQRLRTAAASDGNLVRRRQLLVFDRFLARVFAAMANTAVLKGGLALELRLDHARTTKDVDLRLVGTPAEALDRLQDTGRLDLGDFLTFEVRPDALHPEMRTEGMVYEGLRFQAEARLAGKPYGQPFGVDVAFADPILGDPDELVGDDFLGFAGVEPPRMRRYPIETHLAEKLHAYTLPRARPNSRVKDLPDLALLGGIRPVDAAISVVPSNRRSGSAARTHRLRRSPRRRPIGLPSMCAWRTRTDCRGRLSRTSPAPPTRSSALFSRMAPPSRGTRFTRSWT